MVIEKILLVALLILVLPSTGNGDPKAGSSKDESREQMTHIQEELSREKERFVAFDSKEKRLLQEFSTLKREVDQKKEAVARLKERIRAEKIKEKDLMGELGGLEKSLTEAEVRLAARLVVLYKYTRKGSMKILAGARDLDELRKRTKYLGLVMASEQRTLEELQGERMAYKKRILGLRRRLAEIHKREKGENRRLSALKKELQEKVIHLVRVHKEKEFYRTGVEELKRGAEELKQTLRGLGVNGRNQARLPSDFGEAKGKLPLPVKDGMIQTRKKGQGKDKGRKGIYIESRGEMEVKAVYPGRVDYSGTLRGYGEMVIINHGSRYFTVSAYLARRLKKKGEWVKRGDPVGVLDARGGLSRPLLYFEIRKGDETLDPLKWLAVRKASGRKTSHR